MKKYIFITGPGRCGTHLVLSLLDGNKNLNIVPGEVTNFFKDSLEKNGLSNKVFKNSLNNTLNIFFNELEVYKFNSVFYKKNKIKKLLIKKYNKKNYIKLHELLDIITDCLFDNKKTTVINIQDENIIGLLDYFNSSKVIHMLRNPLTQINSRYNFRYKVPNNYPEPEFSNSFFRNYNSFKNAFNTKSDKRVISVKMENLIRNTKMEMKKICKFLSINFNKINTQTTFNSQKINTYNMYHRAKIRNVLSLNKDGVKPIETDYSNLTPSDLHIISKMKYVKFFYKIKNFKKSKFEFIYFYLRHLGFLRKKRIFSLNPYRLIKLSIFSIYLYFLDKNIKKIFLRNQNI